MFGSRSVTVRFDENKIDVAVLYKDGGKVLLDEVKSIDTGTGSKMGVLKFNNNEIKRELQAFFTENRNLPRKVNVILSLEGIITRIVECPVMKKRDLENFISNNINDYFTLNTDDYCFDYKVLERQERKVQKYVLLLAAFPKTRLIGISNLLRSCGLRIKRVSIYPECIASLFEEKKDLSIAVFDTDPGINSVTLLEKGRIFLYSRMEADFYDESIESKEKLLDDMEYFLNFYSARHFGSKIDRIYLIGGLNKDAGLIKKINERFGIRCESGIVSEKLTIRSGNGPDKDRYCDIYGDAIKIKNIFNKEIDFKHFLEIYEGKNNKKRINIRTVAIFIAILTFLLPALTAAVLEYMLHVYDTDGLMDELSHLSHVERELDELERLRNEYAAIESNLEEIDENAFNYIDYLKVISGSLPDNALVEKITLDQEQINISLSIKNSTLDKARLVEAINDMGIFERLELDTIALDDSETSANFTLVIKKPLS